MNDTSQPPKTARRASTPEALPPFRLSLTMTRRIVRRLIEANVRLNEKKTFAHIRPLPSATDHEHFLSSLRILRRVMRRMIG